MTNENDAILERMRGVPARRMSKLEAMMDPTYPQRHEANDNDKMIDRVALAIRESYGCEGGIDGFRACVVEYCSCREVAREAITALRTPTGQMLEAGEDARKATEGGVSTGMIWQAMIDAALSKEPT